MSAELHKLAEELTLHGYSNAGTILSGLADNMRETGLIPDSLNTEGGPGARGRKFGTAEFPIDSGTLNRLRREQELSQRRLAHRSALSIATISAIERGRTLLVSSETAARLARGLGVEAEFLRRREISQL